MVLEPDPLMVELEGAVGGGGGGGKPGVNNKYELYAVCARGGEIDEGERKKDIYCTVYNVLRANSWT